jgi:hypothetical protein
MAVPLPRANIASESASLLDQKNTPSLSVDPEQTPFNVSAAHWIHQTPALTAPEPLTTRFVPPSDCGSLTFYVASLTTDVGHLSNPPGAISTSTMVWNNLPWGSLFRSTCYPYGYKVNNESYYSPGVCPEGWGVTVVSDPAKSRTAAPNPHETVAVCCPRRYQYRSPVEDDFDMAGLCYSVVMDVVTGTMMQTEGYRKQEIFHQGNAKALPLQIRWQSTDPVISGTPKTNYALTVPSTSSLRSEGVSNPPRNGSMAMAQIIGMSIGTFFIVVIIICIIFWWRFRRILDKKLSERKEEESAGSSPVSYQKAELADTGVTVVEIASGEILEMPGTEPRELEGLPRNHGELEGSNVPEVDSTGLAETEAKR